MAAEEPNEYRIEKLWEEEGAPEGSYNIPLRSISKKELRIDYWTGAFLVAAFGYLAFSGIMVFLYYQQGSPYLSSQAIILGVPLGHVILTSHLYMAYAMVILVYVHMFRNYFKGAYRGKWRWLQWITGVLLFILVNTIAILGYLLQETYISVAATHVMELLIERSVVGRLFPALANWVVGILIGNGTTGAAFGHILALHVTAVGALIMLLIGVHFFLFEKSGPHGINEEEEEKLVKKKEKNIPWFPANALYTGFVSLVFIGIVLIFSALFMQHLQTGYGVLTYGELPFPDWYIMPVYKLMDLAGYGLSTGGVPLVTLFFVFLFIVPFIDRYKESGPLQRPMITAFGVFFLIALPVMALWGYTQPGLTQTRMLTMYMWWGITFVSFLTVYAMKFAKKDLDVS
jgi:quinol-cytochrome oxidoreductase complex cytochrome b subunit